MKKNQKLDTLSKTAKIQNYNLTVHSVLGTYFGPGANFEGDTRGFFCFLSYNLHDTTYCLPLLYDFEKLQ